MNQMEMRLHAAARDHALELFETHRSDLVLAAKAIAEQIAREKGRVTSPEIITILRRSELAARIDEVDRRFMGAVFRGPAWKRIGFESTGSHKRPVSIWRLAE